MKYKLNKRVLATGLIGTVASLICCFTPAAVVLLGALGLAALIAWLDYIVLPALAFFILLAVYGAVSTKRRESSGNE